jgi:hypothetical protein
LVTTSSSILRQKLALNFCPGEKEPACRALVLLDALRHAGLLKSQIADPLWRDLVKNSNEGTYGEFVKNFSGSLARAMNQVEAGHQFANSELARNLSEDVDYLGIIRRGEHVTVLYRQRSTKKEGEWLGRLVLGHENGAVRIFAASIF